MVDHARGPVLSPNRIERVKRLLSGRMRRNSVADDSVTEGVEHHGGIPRLECKVGAGVSALLRLVNDDSLGGETDGISNGGMPRLPREQL